MPAESFLFREISFDTYHYTDNRAGVDCHYLACMKKGRCRIVSEGTSVDIETGDIFYIPKGCRYESFWHGESEIRFDSYGFTMFPLPDGKSFPVQVIPCGAEEQALARRLSEDKSVSCQSLSVFFGLLHRLLPHMAVNAPTKDIHICAQAEAFLAENPTASNAKAAQFCMVSESTLYAAFRNARHTTPNEVRQKLCVERAVSLLTTTDLSIEHISSSLGFSSTSYFRKILKKHLGLTPRQIRRTSVY